jgi:nucleotide-binding universal stress UspA family protein
MSDILVGVDSSSAAERALDRALLDGQRTGLPVRVLHVWQAPVWVVGALGYVTDYDALAAGVGSDHDARLLAEELVAKARTRLTSHAPVTVQVEVVQGSPGRALVAAAHEAVELVVGGRGHGALASALLGSTTSYVAHHAPCPVTIVPEHGAPVGPYHQVVVGVDGSPGARAALRFGCEAAMRERCPLVVVHAWTLSALPTGVDVDASPEYESAEQATRDWLAIEVRAALGDTDDLLVRLDVVHGHPAETLLGAAGPDDLLVLGSRGRGGFAGLRLGSVSTQCARHAHGTVTVLRTGQDEP